MSGTYTFDHCLKAKREGIKIPGWSVIDRQGLIQSIKRQSKGSFCFKDLSFQIPGRISVNKD